MFLHLLRIRYHFMHYLEAFVIIPKFFYLCFTPIFHNWTTPIFSGVPALRYFTVYILANDHFLF